MQKYNVPSDQSDMSDGSIESDEEEFLINGLDRCLEQASKKPSKLTATSLNQFRRPAKEPVPEADLTSATGFDKMMKLMQQTRQVEGPAKA